MDIVTKPLPAAASSAPKIPIKVERVTLGKRRWRGLADDGREFGFALDDALKHGDVVFVAGEGKYVVEQKPEPCLVVALPEASAAAKLGWMIGNLHFPLMASEDAIITPDDSAIRQMFDREGIPYREERRVFIHSGSVPAHKH